MRGPGLHVSPDLRRQWKCPACGRERLVGQTETTVICRCQDPPKFMQLVEGKRVVRPEPRPVAYFFAEEDMPPDEVDPNAPPVDPSLQMVPAQTTPAEPRPPRPPRSPHKGPPHKGPPQKEGERSGDRPGGPRPPRDKGRPQDGHRDRRGPGPKQGRPQPPAVAEQSTPVAPPVGDVVASPPTAPGAADESGDRPRKKRRRNRDRNREAAAAAPPTESTPGDASSPPPMTPPPPPQDDFGAGL